MNTQSKKTTRHVFYAFLTGFLLFSSALSYAASAINGKVLLDYTGSHDKYNFPVAGATVGLYNNNNELVGAPVQSAADGTYRLSAPAAGKYSVRITEVPAGGYLLDGTFSQQNLVVDGVISSDGGQVYVVGSGGKINGRLYADLDLNNQYNAGDKLLANYSITLHSPLLAEPIEAMSNTQGEFSFINLPGGNFEVKINNGNLVNNGYTQWATSQGFEPQLTFTLSKNTQLQGELIARLANSVGIEGITVVDSDDNGVYYPDTDLPKAGAKVGLFYKAAPSVRVIGQPAQLSDNKGKFQFKNVALGEYIVKLETLPTDLTALSPAELEVNVANNGSPSAGHYFLMKVANGAGSSNFPAISGFVFAGIDGDFTATPGPDGGGTGFNSPSARAVRFASVPVTLYHEVDGQWQKLIVQLTKADGSYRFNGLDPLQSYKVVMDPAAIPKGYAFMSDRDGKSPHTGGFKGTAYEVKPYEIIVKNLNKAATGQNFWFSTVYNRNLLAISIVRTVNGGSHWGDIQKESGVPANAGGVSFSVALFEEDGITPATAADGTPIPALTITTNSIRDGKFELVDRAAIYTLKAVEGSYDDSFTLTNPVQRVISQEARSSRSFIFAGNHNISGRIFVDLNGNGVYDPDIDIPLKGLRLAVKRESGINRLWTALGSDTNGIYSVTNLPEGDYQVKVDGLQYIAGGLAQQIKYAGDVDGASTPNTFMVTLKDSIKNDSQDIWFAPIATDFVIQGTTWLDTWAGDGKLQPKGANGQVDSRLDGVLVELLDSSGQQVIDSQITTWENNAKFEFSGLNANTTYQVRATKSGLVTVDSTDGTISNGPPVRTVTLGAFPSVQPAMDFLLQGPGYFSSYTFNDRNGNILHNVGEYGSNSHSQRLYHKKAGEWQLISKLGTNNDALAIFTKLEPGDYRYIIGDHVSPEVVDHYLGINPRNSTAIVDKDPSTPAGMLDFTITEAGERFDLQSTIYTTYADKGISGSIWLDTNNNGIIDSGDIPLPAQSGLSVEGYYSPYFYPDYNRPEEIALAAISPRFIAPVNADGTYQQTHANTVGGKMQSTNYIVALKGLSPRYTLVNDADGVNKPDDSYLSLGLQHKVGVINVEMPVTGRNDQDFLVRMTEPTAVNGRVFYDTNANDGYDLNIDTPLSGVIIELWSGAAKISTARSGADGKYIFANLFDGEYEVRIADSVSNEYTLKGPASYAKLAINGDSLIIEEQNFWYGREGDAAITGSVAVDINNNGQFDTQEDIRLGGMQVKLYNIAYPDVVLQTAATNSRGVYGFGGLAPANYRVVLDTANSEGNYRAFVDIDNTSPVGVIDNISLQTPKVVSAQDFLVAGATNTQPEQGNGAPEAKNSGIYGRLFIDIDQDGVYNPAVDGLLTTPVIVHLWQNNAEIARTTSDPASGNYQFYNLDSDHYQVRISTAATDGLLLTGDRDGGTLGEIDITLSQNGQGDQDFWYRSESRKGIEGHIYADYGHNSVEAIADNDDIPLTGVEVKLYDITGSIENARTLTNSDGYFQFPNLIYGDGIDYRLRVTAPTDYTVLADSDNTTPIGDIAILDLPQSGSDNHRFFLSGQYHFSGKIWLDNNANQKFDQGIDSFLPAQVNLDWAGPDGEFGTADDVIGFKSQTASDLGVYDFTDLSPGVYRTKVETSAELFAVTHLIPAELLNGNSMPRELVLSASVTEADFAFQYSGKVSGTLYQDVDGNAASGAVDRIFPAQQVTITNGTLSYQTITDSQGNYLFTHLPAGEWQVSAAPANYYFSYAEGGQVNADTVSVAIADANPEFTSVNLGFKGTGKLSGKIVIDHDLTDGALAQVIDTPLPAGLIVTLSSTESGFVTRNIKLNDQGEYDVTDLSPYQYTLSIDTTQPNFPQGIVIGFDPVNGMQMPASSVVIAIPDTMPSINNQDFGFKGMGSISGKVTQDIDGNGQFTGGIDKPFTPALTITLTSHDGTATRHATTQADGSYSFTNLPIDNWALSLSTPAGYEPSYAPATVAITADNNQKADINVGFKGSASISGKVVFDNDPNDGSSLKPIDTPLPAGILVTLTGESGFVSHSVALNEHGEFTFNGLSPYRYGVSIDIEQPNFPTGYVPSFNPKGEANSAVDITVSEKMSPIINQHFGFRGDGSISGRVTRDKDVSGNYTSVDDSFIPAITVTLSDANGVINSRTVTTSTTDGSYTFGDVGPGNWLVSVKPANIPTDYVFSYATGGTPKDNHQLAITTTATDRVKTGLDFGFKGSASISGKVVFDNDPNDGSILKPIDTPLPAGILVTLTGESGFVSHSVALNEHGEFTFNGLSPYRYGVSIDVSQLDFPAGYVASFNPNGEASSAVDITVSEKMTPIINQHFGFRGDGNISGRVTQDIDGDGQFTDGIDQVFSTALTITLTNNDRTITHTTTTLEDGSYTFNKLTEGSWTLSLNTPEGYAVSYAPTTVVMASNNDQQANINFGFKGTARISGKVVFDLNPEDGTTSQQIDRPFPADVKVTLSGPAGFKTLVTTTDIDGNYQFTHLFPGDRTLGIDLTQGSPFPTGYTISFHPNGKAENATDTSVPITIATVSDVISGKDFGFKANGSISGQLRVDIEGRGVFSTVDTNYAAQVKLSATQGNITRTTTSDVSGYYEFNSLGGGEWEVYIDSADLPKDYGFSYALGDKQTEQGTIVDINLNKRGVLAATNVDFGLHGSAEITGRLIFDNDDTDGKHYNPDVDTLFGAGYSVTLSGKNGFVPFTVTTDSKGEYRFANLTAYPDYTVMVVAPNGYVPSFEPDSMADGIALIAINGNSEHKTAQDFAVKGGSTISGRIYADNSDNGHYQSDSDTPLSGIVVTLSQDGFSRTANTNSQGEYRFAGVTPGNWQITAAGVAEHYTASFDYDDPHGQAVLPASPNSSAIHLNSGTEIANADFGYIERGRMKGKVLSDENAPFGILHPADSGIAGVKVHLLQSDGKTPVLDHANNPIIASTNDEGEFSLRNLASGQDYTLKVNYGTAPLAYFEPTYDSDALLRNGVSGIVDTVNKTHIIKANLSASSELTSAKLYFGYRLTNEDITLQKRADKTTARIGEMIPYRLTITNNNLVSPALKLKIEDLTPAGFQYVKGSARLDGKKFADPSGDRPLYFNNIDIPANGKRVLTYFLIVGAGVTQGEYINRAVVQNVSGRAASNSSEATVKVVGDPLFNDSLIFGKVYIDLNENGIQDNNEVGLSGVKLVTGRGEIITTDTFGRYHLAAVDGGRWERGTNFILKLDTRSLPKEYRLLGRNPVVIRLSPGLPTKIDFQVQKNALKE